LAGFDRAQLFRLFLVFTGYGNRKRPWQAVSVVAVHALWWRYAETEFKGQAAESEPGYHQAEKGGAGKSQQTTFRYTSSLLKAGQAMAAFSTLVLYLCLLNMDQ